MENVEMYKDLATEALEAELCSIAARLAASTCQFLMAVAEYDRRRAWEDWECHDMAGWLSWKCGISPVTAREQVRVARALEKLPLLTERFVSGRLSYSQVRAVSRVASPENETSFVELAEVSTAAQLESICRAYRRSSEAAKLTADRRDAGRYLRYHYDDEGSLVGTFRLPTEEGALVAAALGARAGRREVSEADADGALDPYAAALADALVELVVAGAEAPERDDDSRYLVTIIAEEQVLAGGERPDESKAPVAGGPAVQREGEGGEDPAWGRVGADMARGPGVCQVEEGPGFAACTARRIACDADAVRIELDAEGNPLDLGRRRRLANRALRRALRLRDQHCRFPGCRRTAVQAHHLWHWIDGGPTKLDNLLSLCHRHHRRVHEGGWRILADPGGKLCFVHPEGWVLPAVPTLGPDGDRPEPEVAPYSSGWDGTALRLGDVVDGLLQEAAARDSAESRLGAHGQELCPDRAGAQDDLAPVRA